METNILGLKQKKGALPFWPPNEKGSILVVDDDLPVVSLCKAMICALGYAVKTAGNGRDALAVAGDPSVLIRLVLLDMNLPDMALEEVVFGMRRIDERIRIIVQSGELLREDDFEARGVEIFGFLQKPFSMRELSEKLDQALRTEATGRIFC